MLSKCMNGDFWCFDWTVTVVEILMQSVQLDCEKVHSRSCEFLHYVRLDYIRSTERLIWDPAKFSHTRFLADRSGLKEAAAGQIWSEANVQYEPVGEEPLKNSNNNNTLYFSLNHNPYPLHLFSFSSLSSRHGFLPPSILSSVWFFRFSSNLSECISLHFSHIFK